MERQYDFDRVIDRRGTDCVKFDFAVEHGLPADVLPLWVADMDFQAPPEVLEALHEQVSHGIYGYADAKPDYYEAVAGWFRRRFDWAIEPAWIVKTPGVVYALAMAVQALTAPGDAVLVQPPVYPPFFNVVRSNGRRVVESQLVLRDGRYEIDFDDFEAALRSSGAKLFILCSPHNPVGRVWTVQELRRIGEICLRHGVTVVSDEIHCDFSWPDHPHTPLIKAVPELADQAIVCTAPSKTFNLAGLQASNVFIPNPALRGKFTDAMRASGYSQPNNAGMLACKIAYRVGDGWLDQLLGYLRGNRDFLRDFLRRELPMLRLIEPEGTYLAWVDFSALGLDRAGVNDLIIHRAGLWLDEGHMFGDCGDLFQRIVLACPRATLRQALDQLKAAVDGLA